MAKPERQQCRECGSHTVTDRCGTCQSTKLGPVDDVRIHSPLWALRSRSTDWPGSLSTRRAAMF